MLLGCYFSEFIYEVDNALALDNRQTVYPATILGN